MLLAERMQKAEYVNGTVCKEGDYNQRLFSPAQKERAPTRLCSQLHQELAYQHRNDAPFRTCPVPRMLDLVDSEQQHMET